MSPLPFFAAGQPLSADDANTLARQGVITVETTLDRDNLPAPHDGMTVYVEAESAIYIHAGGDWRLWWIDTGWVELELINGWEPATPQLIPAVRRIGNTVAMVGRITGGSDAVVASLPAVFRPVRQQHQDVARDASGNNTYIVIVQTNGNVSVGGSPTGPNLDTVWFT